MKAKNQWSYDVMYQDVPVCTIASNGLVRITGHLPYDLYLEECEDDLDTRLMNLDNFRSWCANRVLTLDRKHVKQMKIPLTDKCNHGTIRQKLLKKASERGIVSSDREFYYMCVNDIKTGKGSETMYIAVCDDEKETRELLAEKIRMIFREADISIYPSGSALIMADSQPDILLLDIQMPCKDGMETARELRKKWKETVLIFVTAIEDYVFQAFDVRAFHYLVKPVDDTKLAEVLKNAREQFEDNRQRAANKEVPSLIITTGGRHIIVKLEDIVYAEVYDRKIILHTLDEDIEYYGKMKELEKKVGEEFYRPHRSYLVNFDYIRKYDATTIYLERGQALMAKQNYQDFVKYYLKYNQRKEKYYG